MGTSRLMALAILFGGLASTPAWAAPIYKSADFAGGLNSVTSSMKSQLTAAGFNSALFNCSTCAGATSVTGKVIFDSSLPVPGGGAVNVFSIGAIPNVANGLIFDLDIDGISLEFGAPGVQGGPAVQYLNGAFNGFFFAEDFLAPDGQTQVRFNLQGGTFNLRKLTNGTPGATLFTGFLTVGANGLTNVQNFDPSAPPQGVPEPGTLALVGAALAGAFALRRRKASALRV